MIEDRILRAIEQKPMSAPRAADVLIAGHSIVERSLLQYGADILRHEIIVREMIAPTEIIVSVVICPFEGPDVQLLARSGSHGKLERQSLSVIRQDADFMALAKTLKKYSDARTLRHYEATAPGHLSSHSRLTLRSRMRALDDLATRLERITL